MRERSAVVVTEREWTAAIFTTDRHHQCVTEKCRAAWSDPVGDPTEPHSGEEVGEVVGSFFDGDDSMISMVPPTSRTTMARRCCALRCAQSYLAHDTSGQPLACPSAFRGRLAARTAQGLRTPLSAVRHGDVSDPFVGVVGGVFLSLIHISEPTRPY